MPNQKLEKLIEVVKALRDPQTGCPWDLEQDHDSLKPFIIEEAYEVLDAIDSKNDEDFADELGDLLLQVVLHSQLANERKAFNIEKVIQKITDKMIRRHPHVFGDARAKNSNEVLKNWEKIKQEEKKNKEKKNSERKNERKEKKNFTQTLESIPQNIPALIRAEKIGNKSAKFNFDWSNIESVFLKVREEINELEQEIKKLNLDNSEPLGASSLDKNSKNKITHEVGDLLFSIAQLSRWLGISSEDALRVCNNRFTERIRHIEQNSNKSLNDLETNQLELLWNKAKEFQALRLK